MNLINKGTKKKVSWIGKRLHNFEIKICKNSKIFLEMHSNSIDIFFLLIYVLLQLLLVIFLFILNKGESNSHFIITIFIILFLFILSLERIIMRIKARFEKEAREVKGVELAVWFYRLKKLLDRIEKKENKRLKKRRELH